MDYLNTLHVQYSIKSSKPLFPPKMKTPLRTLYMDEIIEREKLVAGDTITLLTVNDNDDIFLFNKAIYVRKDGPFLYFIDTNNSELICMPFERIITIYNDYYNS